MYIEFTKPPGSTTSVGLYRNILVFLETGEEGFQYVQLQLVKESVMKGIKAVLIPDPKDPKEMFFCRSPLKDVHSFEIYNKDMIHKGVNILYQDGSCMLGYVNALSGHYSSDPNKPDIPMNISRAIGWSLRD